jgi:hypothetical protein
MPFADPEPNADTYTIQMSSKLHGVERYDMGSVEFVASANSPEMVADLEIFQRVLREAGFVVLVRRVSRQDAMLLDPPPVETPEEPDS